MKNVSDLINKPGTCTVVPVIKIEEAHDAPKLAEALSSGGILCAEVTFRTDAAADAISYMKKTVPQMCVGAGTVYSIETCKKALSAGAEFIVSPGCPHDLAEYCRTGNIPFIPGISTATELINAIEYGFKYVKFFPAEACGGIDTLKALAAPFPDVRFMPTGGISLRNIGAYLNDRHVFAVGASFIADSRLIDAHDFNEIRKRALQVTEISECIKKPETLIVRTDIKKGKIITFGEIMLRLSPYGSKKTSEAESFEASYGGAEANVAISLSVLGEKTSFVTKLPDNTLSTGAVRTLRRYGVDTSDIVTGGNRLGMYIYEKGTGCRPANVTYDRTGSAIAEASENDFDWDKIFEGASWFHLTGITPALSVNTESLSKKALQKAKEMGLTVSCDLNYRSKLWNEEKASSVMKPLMKYVDVFIGNEEHTAKVLGIRKEVDEKTESFLKRLQSSYGFSYTAITYRRTLSPEHNTFRAVICDGKQVSESRLYDMEITERVGGGDAFAAGLIYGLMNGHPLPETVEFAAAACAVKHSIVGDFSTATSTEISPTAAEMSAEVKR